jgi:hypothetical protein
MYCQPHDLITIAIVAAVAFLVGYYMARSGGKLP